VAKVLKNEASVLLEMHLEELGLVFAPEFKFHPARKWRFDYLLGGGVVAVEIEGAIWTQGRHTRGSGYAKDLEKYREAAALGYKVYRFSTQEVLSGVAREFIAKYCT
jgi:very-short-patch-repair endonuclease